jgi:probable rRNA maturation factor
MPSSLARSLRGAQPGKSKRLARPSIKVHVLARTRLERSLSVAAVKRMLVRMGAALKLVDVELSVLLTDDVQMRELNRVYRKKDKTTDVLAFAMAEGDGPKTRLLGDVIVSLPTARAQAAAAGRPVADEVTMLLAHGLLHLLGWDHETPRKDQAMRRETERLCRAARRVRKVAPLGSQRRLTRPGKLS